MSANAHVLRGAAAVGSSTRETALPQVEATWAPNSGIRKSLHANQIRGLVRRVFFGNGGRPVKTGCFQRSGAVFRNNKYVRPDRARSRPGDRAHVALLDTRQDLAESAYPRALFRGTASINRRPLTIDQPVAGAKKRSGRM